MLGREAPRGDDGQLCCVTHGDVRRLSPCPHCICAGWLLAKLRALAGGRPAGGRWTPEPERLADPAALLCSVPRGG